VGIKKQKRPFVIPIHKGNTGNTTADKISPSYGEKADNCSNAFKNGSFADLGLFIKLGISWVQNWQVAYPHAQ
jgi:hypothetical protein